MATASCPVCKEKVAVSESWVYPNGAVKVFANHDDPHSSSPVCSGSLKPIEQLS